MELNEIKGSYTLIRKFKENGKIKGDLKCICGKIVQKRLDYLNDPKAQLHCGCLKPKLKDKVFIGAEFNKLTVIGPQFKIKKSFYVNCECQCGVIKPILVYSLLNEESKSCGCTMYDHLHSRIGENHPNYSHGRTYSKEYRIWTRIKSDSNWHTFEEFDKWYKSNKIEGYKLYKKDLNLPHSDINSYFVDSSTNIIELYRQNTSLNRYGETSYAKTVEFKERKKKTNLLKYGFEHANQSPIIRKETYDRYFKQTGYKHSLSNPETREKIKQTNLVKYGCEFAQSNDLIKGKMRSSMVKSGRAYEIQGKTTREIALEKGIAHSTLVKWIKQYGVDLAIKMVRSQSGLEQQMSEWLKTICDFKQEVKIGRYFADFVIDKLVIECDGLYWHSDRVIKDRLYHVNKRKFYIEHGYQPLFFREDELLNKFDIIKSMILHKMGKTDKIFARKCNIQYVDKTDFFEENHLMGRGRGRSVLLTQNNNNIVMGLQYFIRNGILEIDRLCSKKNTSVVGGFSRLLKYLPQYPISTFVDLRYGTGDYLPNLGFELISNYPSFKWAYSNTSVHRSRFLGNSGYKNRYAKIWDCGQAKYIKNPGEYQD